MIRFCPALICHRRSFKLFFIQCRNIIIECICISLMLK
jgi:hypothetical protein